MSEEQEVVQTEAEALASMMAGYNKTRGDQPPVEEVPEPSADAVEVVEPTEPETQEIAPVIEPPSIADLSEELKTLKAKVAASSSDPDMVRKMHGEIGNINRTLKKLQTAEAPDDDLSAALKDAEAVAEEFPEIGGPLLRALKASLARKKPADEPSPEPEQEVRQVDPVAESRKKDIQTLDEVHPDRLQIYASEKFKSWLSAKPIAYQKNLLETWNPIVASKGLDEFKDSLKTEERKQTRLAAAIAPQGVTQKAKPSALTEDEALWAGYNKGPKRNVR